MKQAKISKLEGTLNFIMNFCVLHLAWVWYFCAFYLAYDAKNVTAIIFLLTIYAYQFSPYCTKKEWFLKALRVNVSEKYFKEWKFHAEEPIAKQKAMIPCHPHGILDHAFFITGFQYYDNTTFLSSRALLATPMTGLFLRWIGADSVNQANLNKLMKNNRNIALIPGGFEEATLTSPKENRVFLKNRKGFIKYAIKYGYSIYPSFTFGENKLYNVFEPFLKLRLMINKFKVPAAYFWTKYGLLPKTDVKVHTYVGKPIKTEQNSNPTKEMVEKYHKEYVQALTDLYNKNKKNYGETSDLVIY